jgi:hypothetical protein
LVKIILSGRIDIDQYFKLSNVFDCENLNHAPFLVFDITNDTLHIQIVDNAKKILAYQDETPVMGQWRGDYHSDYFQFKVGQYRKYLEAKDAVLVKTVRQVVKHLGPLGGFRYLSYEYMNENGTIVSTGTGSKAEAERLESVFLKNNIPVEIQKVSRQ